MTASSDEWEECCVITIKTRPGPFQVMFLAAAIIGGAALLILRSHLGSTLSRQLPDWVTVVLSAGMVATGAVAMFGTLRQSLIGMLAERVGLSALGALLLLYSAFTLHYAGLRGLVTVVFFVAITAACVWRVLQIGQSLAEIRMMTRAEIEGGRA